MSVFIANERKSEKMNKFFELGLGLWLCLGLFIIMSSMVWSLSGSAYITRIHLFWVLPSLLFGVFYWRYFLQFWASFWPLLLFFTSLLIASAFLVEDTSGLSRDVKAIITLIFGMPALVRLMNERNFLVFDVVLFFAGLIVCSYVLVELYAVYAYHGGRAVGRFEVFPVLDNPLYMAQYVGALAVFCLGAAWRVHQNKGQIWWVFILMFMILALAAFKTESRSWLVAMALVVCVIMYSTKRFGWMVVGIIAVAVVGWFFKDQIFARGISMSYRDDIWMEGLRQGMEKPMGQGSAAELRVLRWWEPHNLFLTMWMKYGIVPLTLFVFSILWVVNQLRIYRPKTYFECLLPLAFGVGMLFFEGANIIHRPNESWMLIWVPICFLIQPLCNQSERFAFLSGGVKA